MMKHKIWILLLLLLNNSSLLFSQHCRIGDVITNPDGSKGVVFYLNPDRLGGWMVALNDQSSSCKWGTNTDIPDLPNYTAQDATLLTELDGKENTGIIRAYQNNSTTYAAGKVDFAHGWYLPSIGQLRILFGTLALIEPSLIAYGGSSLGNDKYWSSTEQDAGNAKTLTAEQGAGFHSIWSKSSNAAVRAIHDFSFFEWSDGSIADHIEVAPTETTPYSVTVQTGTCGVAEASIEVMVSPMPHDLSIYPAGPLSICEGNVLQLQAQTSNTADWNYVWSDLVTGQTFAVTGTTLQVEANTLGVGQHEIQVTVSSASNENCSESTTVEVTVNPLPTVDAGPDQTIPYGSQATLIAEDAGEGATYSWSPANKIQGNPNQQTVTTINLTADQTYTLTVTLNGCEDTDEVTVFVNNPLNASVSVQPDIICPGETATLSATASEGTGNYSYSWSPAELIASGVNSATATTIGLEETTTFTCTVFDGNQTLEPTADVLVRVLPTASASADETVLCSGSATTLHAANAAGATFAWSPADKIQGNPNLQNVTTKPLTETTTFLLTVTRHDCENTDEVTITVNQYPDAYAGEDQTIPYNTATTLIAEDAGEGVNYSWLPADKIQGNPNQRQVTTTNLIEDQIYELTVTSNGCDSYSEMTVYVTGALHATATAQPESICPEETATLTAIATEGTGNYTYSWSPANLINGANNLATVTTMPLTTSEEFTCTVSDGNQTLYPTVTVNVKPLPTANATADETTLCSGLSTMLHATAVTGATYSWSPADKIQGNPNQQNVATVELTETTIFHLTVTLDGCENTDEVTVNVNQYPTADAGTDQTIPYNTSTTLTATDAGTGATYSWTPPTMIQGNPNQRQVITTNLTADQTYHLTVTLNGCESSDEVTVHVGTPLTATATAQPESICPEETATLTAIATEGTGNYTYSWSPANLINGANNLATVTTMPLTTSEEFTCTVSDGNQTLYPTVTVNVKPLPTANATADETTLCSGLSTMLHATAVTGAIYSWSPADKIQGNPNQQNVATVELTETTIFHLTVTLDGCENTDEVTVTVNPMPIADAGDDFNIGYNAHASLIAGDAGDGANYHWSPEDFIENGQGTANATTIGLTETTEFTLTVTLNGCTTSDQVTVIVGDQLYVTTAANPSLICPEETSTLTATASYGTGNYSYSWTPIELIATGQASSEATTVPLEGLTVFTCTVNDGNETTLSEVTVTVKPLPEALATADETALCSGESTTLHTISIPGASYSWSPAELIQGDPTQQSVTTTALSETVEFTVTVILDGCENTDAVTVTVHDIPIANAGNDQSIPFGAQATLTAADAGAGAEYHWEPEDLIMTGQDSMEAVTVDLEETTPFTLFVTLNGCQATDQVTVYVGEGLVASVAADPQSVCQGETSTLTATAIGGTGEYSFVWEPAEFIDGDNTLQTVTTIGLNETKVFTCFISDGNETLERQVTVTEKPLPVAQAYADDVELCEGLSTTLHATEVAGAYYSWDPATFIQDDATQLNVTTVALTETVEFTVTVILDGCENTDAVTVTVHDIPIANAGNDQSIPFGAQATLTAADAGAGAEYHWEPEDLIMTGQDSMEAVTVDLEETTPFTLFVTLNGCQATDQVTVYVGEGLVASVAADPQSVCQGETSTLTATAIGGTGEYSFVWEPAEFIDGDNTLQTVTTIGLTETKDFTCFISDGNETLERQVSVTMNPSPFAQAGNDQSIPYGTPTSLTATDAGFGAEYHWEPENLIDGDPYQQIVTTIPLYEGHTFTLTVSLNGCEASDQVSVMVGNELTASVSAKPDLICPNTSTILEATALGGTGDYSYLWKPADLIEGDNTLSTVMTVGLTDNQIFTVTISDSNMTLDLQVHVRVFDAINASISGDSEVCPDVSTILTAYPDEMSYQWSTGETSQTITVTPESPSTHYTVIVTSNNGCWEEITHEVTVNPLPLADAGTEQHIPYNAQAILSAADAGEGADYHWNPENLIDGDPNQQTVMTVNLTEDAVFTLLVTLNGCENNDEITVHVGKQLNVTAEANPSGICYGESTTLMAMAQEGTGNYTYVWGPAEFIQGDNTQATVNTIAMTSDKTFTVTVSDGNETKMAETMVEIIGQSTFYAVTMMACDSYEWHGQHYYTDGDYTFAYSNENGCFSVDTLHLSIVKPQLAIVGYSDVYYSSDLWHGIYKYSVVDSTGIDLGSIEWECSNPDWILLEGEAMQCMLIVTTKGTATLTAHPTTLAGCEDMLSIVITATEFPNDDVHEIFMFPNPADVDVTVKAHNLLKVRVISIWGQNVMEIPPEHNDSTTIPIEGLSSGIYVVEIITEKETYFERLIISK